jgi:uncharacterized membrane protein
MTDNEPTAPKLPVEQRTRLGRVFGRLRTWFLTGLLFIAPLALTIWVTLGIIRWVDRLIAPFIPQEYRPEVYFHLPFAIPGTGLIIVVIGLTVIGALTATLMGRLFVRLNDRAFARLPIIRSLYGTLKQMFETLLSNKAGAFRQVVLVQFPVRGCWAIGFVTGPATIEIQSRVANELVNVFVPTSPNPTSGYLLFVQRSEMTILDMGVEEALKLVVSGGMASAPATAR